MECIIKPYLLYDQTLNRSGSENLLVELILNTKDRNKVNTVIEEYMQVSTYLTFFSPLLDTSAQTVIGGV